MSEEKYFPVRVFLDRREIRRCVGAISLIVQDHRNINLNTFRESVAMDLTTIANLDSSLKFPIDQEFVLITKKEFEELAGGK
jgi:hypothetical protein